jgi:hypothetical protein
MPATDPLFVTAATSCNAAMHRSKSASQRGTKKAKARSAKGSGYDLSKADLMVQVVVLTIAWVLCFLPLNGCLFECLICALQRGLL